MPGLVFSKCARALGGLLVAGLAIFHQPALAYNRVEITLPEWDSWPRYCQLAGASNAEARGIRAPSGRVAPRPTGSEERRIWQVGIWHYCTGLIKIQRAELGIYPVDPADFVKDAMKDLMYSYERISKSDPWASEMAVTVARGYRLQGNLEKASEHLEIARRLRPDYSKTYAVMSMLHFDRKDYDQAVEVLEEGNEATGGTSPELHYFLGLAYFKAHRYEEAKKQARIAEGLGYPLSGLKRMIQDHDRQQDEGQ